MKSPVRFSASSVVLAPALAIMTFLGAGCTSTTNTTATTSVNTPTDTGAPADQGTTPSTTAPSTGAYGSDTTGSVSAGAGASAGTGSASAGASAGTTAKVRAVKTFTMTVKQFAFVPSSITVNKGDHVKLVITNVDVDHGIGIPAFNVDQDLPPGQTTTVEFDADTAGTFPFFCSVFCGSGHRDMRGQIVVK